MSVNQTLVIERALDGGYVVSIQYDQRSGGGSCIAFAATELKEVFGYVVKHFNPLQEVKTSPADITPGSVTYIT